MAKINKKDILLARLESIEKKLRKIFGDSYKEAINLNSVRKAIESGDEFTWSQNKAAEKQLDKLLKQLTDQTNAVIYNAYTEAWKRGEEATTSTLGAVFSRAKFEPEQLEEVLTMARNEMRNRGANANSAYNEKRSGLTISGRVWKITQTSKKEIEAIIQNGMMEGKTPDQIARSVQPYLREPHRLFRRVRNKDTGQLELSRAAREYKPGQGVYRSSYMNALRLARTEVTAAYRRAEWETYQNNPLITGYKIALSNNHTTLIKGVPTPFHDICDDMVGEYPKFFKWTGWHPQCRCVMIPITINKTDFEKRIEALASGKLKDWNPKKTITKMPKSFNAWIKDNAKRIEQAKSLPFWMQDNPEITNK